MELMPEILHGEPSRHMMSPLRTSDKSLEPLGAGLVARMYSSSWALSVLTSVRVLTRVLLCTLPTEQASILERLTIR